MSDTNRQGLVTKSLLLQVIFLQNSDYKGFKLKGFKTPSFRCNYWTEVNKVPQINDLWNLFLQLKVHKKQHCILYYI